MHVWFEQSTRLTLASHTLAILLLVPAHLVADGCTLFLQFLHCVIMLSHIAAMKMSAATCCMHHGVR